MLPVLACIPFLTGCAYMKNRALDFADVFAVKVSYGPGVATGVSASGFFRADVGWSDKTCYPLFRWDYLEEKRITFGVPCNFFLPHVGLKIALVTGLSWEHRPDWFDDGGDWVCALGLFSTGLENSKWTLYDNNFDTTSFAVAGVDIGKLVGEDRLFSAWYQWARYFDITVDVHIWAGFEAGFSPAEFTDFLLGWFNVDIAGDDTKTEEAEPKGEEETEPEEEEE